MEENVVDVPEAKPVQELVDIARDVPDNVTKQVIGEDAPIDDANAGVDELQAVADIEEIVAEVLVEEDSQGSTSTVVEVLGQEQAEDFDDAKYIKQQRERRRARLSRYLTEEVSVENATGSAIGITSFQASSLALPSDQLAPSIDSAAQGAAEQQGDVRGRHFAWCREFDAESGRGVLIDLKERTEWPVNREALLTSGKNSPTSVFLHAGEFVEYKLESARELSTGDEPAGGWVSGIFGWPLMCETAADPTIAKKFRKKQ